MTRPTLHSFRICVLLVSVLSTWWVPTAVAAEGEEPTPLTFSQRVACVEKVEEVYWAHRFWPESNPGPRPPLSAIVSNQQIAANVEESLLYESALKEHWGELLSSDRIQAEMDRIANETLHPDLLRDVFGALNNDGYLIAECFVRPRLAERRLRERYENDLAIHAVTRRSAESLLASGPSSGELESSGAVVSELVWHVGETKARPSNTAGTTPHELLVSPPEFAELVERIERTFGDLATLSDTGFSRLADIDNGFVAIAVREYDGHRLRMTSATWPKQSFDSWFEEYRARIRPAQPSSAHYTSPAVKTKSFCIDNTWEPTSTTGAPASHSFNAKVWTGAEMIVWGGGDFPGTNVGGRYDLATNTWTATTTAGAPSARTQLAGVWTGTEMIVWGGVYWPTYVNTGGRYNPVSNSWTATSTTGAPAARTDHVAVWTGTEMIVWGGNGDTSYFNTGGRYNPSSNTWSATTTTNAPSERRYHTGVWTGTELIVWGGNYGAVEFNTGGRYSPATDSWIATSTTDAPVERTNHTAVWTGSEMIVWGGTADSGWQNTGGRYDPTTDDWTPTSTAGAPEERSYHAAVWTGTEMIVWGGVANGTNNLDTGGRFDPAQSVWMATTTTDAPSARGSHLAIWPGATPKMIVWGGWDDVGPALTGGLYCVSGIVPYDFGDAPDPSYPTLEASDGARHRLGSTLYLGADVDSEADGLPTAAADGDDNDTRDDEDGVTFTSVANPGGVAGVDVEASDTGLLSAWVDFNADGDWDDAGEQVFTDEPLTAGINNLQFAVPGDAVVGMTVGRFRVDSAGGLLPTGAASDGEVEDHMVTIESFDFGDAPDPTYPTLLASNGARHVIDGVTYLGAAVDADPDGQPNANANGDDNDAQGDDEDGISFITWPVAGQLCTIRVTASTAGVVNAWIDYNADGDWADAGEQVFTDVAVVAGQNNLDYTIPITAATGVDTFARFRFSTAGGLLYDGPAPDGEVEDYKMGIMALDYGDAPDPTYPTLDAGDGARHIIGGGLYLGASVDFEADGQPTVGADGDDLDGNDDEDGVVFTSGVGVGLDASLEVTASGAGRLNAWVDFNSDGDWADAGEQIFTDQMLVAGVNSLSIAVPASATLGTSYARFRLDTNGGLAPNGYATDGEVEDYMVEIVEGPDLEIDMTASAPWVASGHALSYTITVTNNGPLTATSVTVTDTLPAELVFVSSTPSTPDCSFAGGTLTCDLGTMTPTDTAQITLETVLDHPVWGTISNTSSVTADELDPITANNTAAVDTTIALFVDGFESGDLSAWD